MSLLQFQTNQPEYYKDYLRWISAGLPEPLHEELLGLQGHEIEDRFYKHLEFGTGGMRGEIGAGTNRMNVYTVRRAAQGMVNYIRKQGTKKQGVAIAYDSRHFSREFAEESALVLANNGIRAFLFDELRTTPQLSFAVRQLKAAAGIVITASHNPPEYNGYKVYGEDGGQIPPAMADALTEEISQVGNELEIPTMTKEGAISQGLLQMIGAEIDESYQQHLESIVINRDLIRHMGDQLRIVYTPLHGTGNKPVREILQRIGFNQVTVVPEQEHPDPHFSTVSSPNPEEREAFQLAIQLAKREQADLILGTDPDADRVGAVVKDHQGEYIVLTGNQTGALLLDYILSQKKQRNELSANGVVLKTIVTSELGRNIAQRYGLTTIDTLTGFKFIGEKIKEFELTGVRKFIFGYEESYGYLIGDFVRDKDAVQSCLMISEMAAFYKSKDLTLYEALKNLHHTYGCYQEDISSITLKGIDGQERIRHIIDTFRNRPLTRIGGSRIKIISDYLSGVSKNVIVQIVRPTRLPQSNVLRYTLEDESWFAIRPSGTEPKLKIYYSAAAESMEDCTNKLDALKTAVLDLIETINTEADFPC